MQTKKLRIALQRSGRLSQGSLELLKKCGLETNVTSNQLLTQDENFGIDFFFARDDDIPGLIENGICDLGIIGQNLLEEYCGSLKSNDKIKVIMPLGFSKCRLSLASPKTKKYESLEELNAKVIATSYPNTLRNFLDENNINAKIVTMHGSVELAPQIGIADLICDLVSSGATLNANGLEERFKVRESEAVLISKPNNFSPEAKKRLDRLLMRINSVLNAKSSKYIMLHIDRDKLPLLSQILPGSESPTVLELKGIPNKVAVHVVSLEDVFWETIEKLKEAGASSILVMPIEKIIF